MNVSLPPALKGFVEKKVKEGIYQSESDVVCDALRGLREREHLLSRNATRPISASSSLHDGDIEAVAFIVLMQATKDMDDDLKMIMAEMKAIIATKQNLRVFVANLNKDAASSATQRVKGQPLSSAQLAAVGPGLERLKEHLSKVEVDIKDIIKEIERQRSQEVATKERVEETQDMAQAIMRNLQKAADAYDEILHSIFI